MIISHGKQFHSMTVLKLNHFFSLEAFRTFPLCPCNLIYIYIFFLIFFCQELTRYGSVFTDLQSLHFKIFQLRMLIDFNDDCSSFFGFVSSMESLIILILSLFPITFIYNIYFIIFIFLSSSTVWNNSHIYIICH